MFRLFVLVFIVVVIIIVHQIRQFFRLGRQRAALFDGLLKLQKKMMCEKVLVK